VTYYGYRTTTTTAGPSELDLIEGDVMILLVENAIANARLNGAGAQFVISNTTSANTVPLITTMTTTTTIPVDSSERDEYAGVGTLGVVLIVIVALLVLIIITVLIVMIRNQRCV
jgi:hypothetical protein